MAIRVLLLLDMDTTAINDYTDITQYVISADWSIGMAEAYQIVANETRLSLTLKNTDKRFSPEYASGPYYGKFRQGRVLRVLWDNNTDIRTSWDTLYIGQIESINPTPGETRNPVCNVQCIGVKQYLEDAIVQIPLMLNVTADEVIEDIIEQVPIVRSDFEAGWILGVAGYSELGNTTYLSSNVMDYTLETGNETFSYVGDRWDDEQSAMEAIADLAIAERGRVWVDRANALQFWNRSHMQLNVTTAGTITGNDWAMMRYGYGDDIYNDVEITYYPRSVGASTTDILWKLDKAFTIRANDERILRASYKDEDSGAEIGAVSIEPVEDYLTTAPTPARVTVIVTEESRGAEIRLINYEDFDVEISALEVRGQKLTSFNDIKITERDAWSITNYGRRQLQIDTRTLDNETLAQSIAEFELRRRAEPRGLVHSVEIQPKDSTMAEFIVDTGVGDVIRVQDGQTSHDANYWIIGEQWSYRDGLHSVEWVLEASEANQGWVLGVSGYGEIGQTTYLGL